MHKFLSQLEVPVGWLNRRIVDKLDKQVENRVEYLDWGGDCCKRRVRWVSSIIGLAWPKEYSLDLAASEGGFPGVEMIFW